MKGYYNELTGSNSADFCIGCPKGTIGTSAGQMTADLCSNCPPGKYSDVLAFAGPSCSNCLKGYYNELTGSNSTDSCIACPKGTIGTSDGQSTSDLCVNCPLGRFSDALAFPGPTCDKCGMGSYNDETGQPNCKKCPLGSLGTELGQVSIEDCEICPVGEFSTNSSLAECNQCLEGWTTKDELVNQTEAQFHNSSKDCRFADLGWWLDEATKELIECPGQDYSCAGYNSCKPGYAGHLCADCSPRFFHAVSGECNPCPAEDISFVPHIVALSTLFLIVLILALNLCKIRTRVQELLKRRTPKVLRILFSVGKAVSERAKLGRNTLFADDSLTVSNFARRSTKTQSRAN